MDVYTGKRIGSPMNRSARLERKMLQAAAEVWFVNAPIRDWHAGEYGDNSEKYHVVANAFDAAFAKKFAGKQPPALTDEGGITFGYLGTIYGPIPLRETLEGWRLARSRSSLAERSRLVIRGRLGHYAEPDPKILKLLEEYGQDAVTYGGPVSKTEVADVYNDFHALLLIIGKSPFVTSGKVFEYAATGLPIASLHHPASAASSILSGHHDWFPVPEVSPACISDSLLETADRAVEMTAEDYARNQAWASHLSRDKQLQPRIGHLTELVAEANRG
jgi:glycosyltransferase involved in cell wall biosynthesis